MNIQFKKGVLELCVLYLLSKRDYYGYEIVQSISEAIQITSGTVYPLLRRLQKEGYFETYLKESGEGPPRKYYHLTAGGKKRKEELLEEWHEFARGINLILEEEYDNE